MGSESYYKVKGKILKKLKKSKYLLQNEGKAEFLLFLFYILLQNTLLVTKIGKIPIFSNLPYFWWLTHPKIGDSFQRNLYF